MNENVYYDIFKCGKLINDKTLNSIYEKFRRKVNPCILSMGCKIIKREDKTNRSKVMSRVLSTIKKWDWSEKLFSEHIHSYCVERQYSILILRMLTKLNKITKKVRSTFFERDNLFWGSKVSNYKK